VTETVESVIEGLRIPPYQHAVRAALEAYGNDRGVEALQRQIDLDKTRHCCCWELKDNPHHPLCREAQKTGTG
jgi:hypothetical protein